MKCDELLPCPFCWGEAQIGVNKESTVREYFIGCMNCHIKLYKVGYKRFYDEAEAIEAWNTRSAGTCENKHKSITSFWCSECDAATSDGFSDVCGKVERFNFCPNCGRKVSA